MTEQIHSFFFYSLSTVLSTSFCSRAKQGQPDCHSFFVSLFFSSKKEVNLSRPFFRKLSSCEHTWIWIYSMCHLYVMKHLPLAFEFQGLNSKLNSVVYLESRKVGSLKKCWAFKMAFTCTMYRFYFISLLLSGAFRIAKNWIHHQFLSRRKPLVFWPQNLPQFGKVPTFFLPTWP